MSPQANHPSPRSASEWTELLAKIEANWPILPSGIWNSSSIQALSRHLHELARRSERTGDQPLKRLIVEIDEAITGIIDDNAPPDDEQMEALDDYLDRLRAMAGRPPAPDEREARRADAPAETWDLLYLTDREEAADPLVHALDRSGLRHRRLADPPALQHELIAPGARTLLIDAAFLGTPSLEPVLHLLKSYRATAPALFVLTDHSNIETRLNAMRAGAAQLFSQPVDTERLFDALRAHINPRPQPKRRVLIVEDDEAQANFASKLLQKGGLDTLAINDPLGVIEAVDRFQPDLILMDLYMPGADGIELTRVIRDRWDSAGTPVVFLSGEDDPEKKLLALHAGADDFLTKPVRPQQLLATVNTRIQRARQIAETARRQVEEPTRPASRRTLLTRLDRVLAESADPSGYHALLVISTGEADPIETEAPSRPALPDGTDRILSLLAEEDLLAVLGPQRLAVLYRRHDESAVEQLAERLHDALSEGAGDADRPGIGMVLLNGAERNAYRQLVRGEASAQSARRQGVKGFVLHGETPLENREPGDAGLSKRQALLRALQSGQIAFKRLSYTRRREQTSDTEELIPSPGPATGNEEPYRLAAECGASGEFDRIVCLQALHRLADQSAGGRRGRLLFRLSPSVAADPSFLEFLKSELRKRQIVGTGLLMELDLPALAANLKQARTLIGELSGMGVAVALASFACNETAFKVLAFLRADAIRPHRSLLRIDPGRIQQIARQAHTLRAEIILPRVARHGEIALSWTEFADYVQSDFSA